ncbi:MAG: YceI family protein [Rhodobacteraceae bacterium]|nr:YceI family protein [Paracoccaceae bacterium]
MKQLSFAVGLSILLAGPVAAWTLDGDSSAVSYVTTKNTDTAEANLLTGLTGSVSDEGQAAVEVSLSSVETFIDIRNERMREILFRVADFPVATVTAALDMDALQALEPGATTEAEFEVSIAANGEETSYDTMAFVTRVGEDRVLVNSKAPIIVYVEDFGYSDGVAQLQEIAGLDSIQPAVPVSFNLSFSR